MTRIICLFFNNMKWFRTLKLIGFQRIPLLMKSQITAFAYGIICHGYSADNHHWYLFQKPPKPPFTIIRISSDGQNRCAHPPQHFNCKQPEKRPESGVFRVFPFRAADPCRVLRRVRQWICANCWYCVELSTFIPWISQLTFFDGIAFLWLCGIFGNRPVIPSADRLFTGAILPNVSLPKMGFDK